MKNNPSKRIVTTFVILVLVLGSLSGFSFASHINNPLLISKGQQGFTKSSNPKISAVLDLIDENLLRQYLEPLVGFAPRMTGSHGCEKSAMFMYEQFTGMGLLARIQNWTAMGNIYHPYLFKSQNVEGTLTGSNPADDSVVIFSAHYDSVKQAPGANDDGSGTAAVLAAAYALSHFSFNRTLRFVGFAGEEEGLLGSHAYVKEAYNQNENIMLDVHADMIGHATTTDGGRRLRLTATEDAAWVFDVFDSINYDQDLNFNLTRGAVARTGKGGSDHFSFAEYGLETLACWDGEHDPNMHTADDNLNNINFSYLVNTTKVIAGALAYLADTQETYPQVQIESPRLGHLYRNGMEKRPIGDLKITVMNDIWIWADVKYATSRIVRAEFYYDDSLEFTDIEPPFKWDCNKISLRPHRVTVIIYDESGRKSTDWREIRFINLYLKK